MALAPDGGPLIASSGSAVPKAAVPVGDGGFTRAEAPYGGGTVPNPQQLMQRLQSAGLPTKSVPGYQPGGTTLQERGVDDAAAAHQAHLAHLAHLQHLLNSAVAPQHPGGTNVNHQSSGAVSGGVHSAPGVGHPGAVGGPAGGGMGGGMGGDSLLQQATNAVNASLNPQLADLRGQQQYLTNLYNSQAGNQHMDTARQEDNIQRIYAALENSLKGVNEQQQQAWGHTQEAVGQNNQTLQEELRALAGGQQNDLARQANALNLGAALPTASTGLQNTGQLLQGLAGTSAANINSLMDTERQGFNNLGANMAQQAGSTGAEKVSALQELSDKQLGTMRDKLNAQLQLLSSKMTNLSAQKNPQIAALYSKLLAQKQTLEATMAYKNRALDLQSQKINDLNNYDQGKLALGNNTLQEKIQQDTLLNPLRAQYLESKINNPGGANKQNGWDAALNVGQQYGDPGDLMRALISSDGVKGSLWTEPAGSAANDIQALANGQDLQSQTGLSQGQLVEALTRMYRDLNGKIS